MAIFGYKIIKVGNETQKSPYLDNHYRLADIIAALQIMGSYKFASRRWNDWEKQMDKPRSGQNWLKIFKEHPEFFRVSKPDMLKKEWISLRWRHGYDQIYSTVLKKELTDEEIEKYKQAEEAIPESIESLSRKPLTSEEIESLITTAIELHQRAIAHSEEKRWVLPLLIGIFTVIGAFLGTIIAALINS